MSAINMWTKSLDLRNAARLVGGTAKYGMKSGNWGPFQKGMKHYLGGGVMSGQGVASRLLGGKNVRFQNAAVRQITTGAAVGAIAGGVSIGGLSSSNATAHNQRNVEQGRPGQFLPGTRGLLTGGLAGMMMGGLAGAGLGAAGFRQWSRGML